MLGLLPAMGLEHVQVVALQDVSCQVRTQVREWQITMGKQALWWRGRAVAICKPFGKITYKEVGTHALGVDSQDP